jgi:hypothetical protein
MSSFGFSQSKAGEEGDYYVEPTIDNNIVT